jgi:hypothetical protein
LNLALVTVPARIGADDDRALSSMVNSGMGALLSQDSPSHN